MKILEERKAYTISYADFPFQINRYLHLGGCYYISKTEKLSDMIYCKWTVSKVKTIEALGRKIMKKVKKELR